MDQKEPHIRLEPIIAADRMKKTVIPDLTFQLNRCGTIKHYIAAALDNTKQYEGTSLWPAKWDDLWIFPFLFCEAKSANAKVSQHSVEFQASLPIREALISQKNLALGPNGRDGDELAFTPLVWCVTYIGERCTVLAATLKYQIGWDVAIGYGMVRFRTRYPFMSRAFHI